MFTLNHFELAQNHQKPPVSYFHRKTTRNPKSSCSDARVRNIGAQGRPWAFFGRWWVGLQEGAPTVSSADPFASKISTKT